MRVGRVARLFGAATLMMALSVGQITSASATSPDRKPVGVFESAAFNQASGDIHLTGWAYDPDHPHQANVVVTDSTDPRNGYGYTTSAYRGDVDRHLHTTGGIPGFDFDFSPRSGPTNMVVLGTHRLCVSVIDVDAGDSGAGHAISLGCRNVVVRSVAGTLESTRIGAAGITLTGWAVDRTWSENSTDNWSNSSVRVHYVDSGPQGTFRYGSTANLARRSTSPSFLSGYLGNHGFSPTIPVKGAGPHRICVTEMGSKHTRTAVFIGCTTVVVPSPIGRLEMAKQLGSNRIRVLGWAVDGTAKGAAVHVSLDVSGPAGRHGYAGATSTVRRDVLSVYPWSGKRQGFAMTLPAAVKGAYRVCVVASAVKVPAIKKSLGCATATIR